MLQNLGDGRKMPTSVRPLKVTFASYDYVHDISGVSSWIIRLLPRLRDRGLDVHAHLFRIGEGTGSTGAALADQDVPVLTAPWPSCSEAGTVQCLAWLGARLPDVYVPNCIVPAYHSVRYLKSAGVKSVGVLHTDRESKDGLIQEFVTGSAQRRVDALVAVSSRLAQEARGVAPAGVRVQQIPCGVSLPAAVAVRAGQGLRLVYVGRLTNEAKRVMDVAKAMTKAAELWPNVEAWLIGEGPERSGVEEIVASSPAKSRIRLLGRISPAAIQGVMAQCHAFVLLSDYEGLSVSMLEAMSAGLVPIVHRDAGGVMEVISDCQNGFIIGDRDASFLAAVNSLRENPDRWAAMSSAARATIEMHYGLDRCADCWHDLLVELGRSGRLDLHWTPPAQIRLPPPNPRLGWFDARRPSLARRLLTNTRMRLGYYRGALKELVPFQSPD